MSEANGILLRRHLRFGWWSLAFFLLIGLYAIAAIALSRLRAAPSGARDAGESA